VLAYIVETYTPIIVTITASSPGAASVTIEITLLYVDTIAFADHANSLAYEKNMTLSATCTTGAIPTLSAEGTGKNTN
jgi:hypothetical protein